MNKKYKLTRNNGNNFNVIYYVVRALKETGHNDLVESYMKKVVKPDCDKFINFSQHYINIANGDCPVTIQD